VDEFSEYTQDDDAIQLPMNDSRVPDDCLDFDIPWIDEEIINTC